MWAHVNLGDGAIRGADSILLIDENVADRWGLIAGEALLYKIALSVIDGLLAAMALSYNLTLVTRNSKDIAHTGVPVYNPWEF